MTEFIKDFIDVTNKYYATLPRDGISQYSAARFIDAAAEVPIFAYNIYIRGDKNVDADLLERFHVMVCHLFSIADAIETIEPEYSKPQNYNDFNAMGMLLQKRAHDAASRLFAKLSSLIYVRECEEDSAYRQPITEIYKELWSEIRNSSYDDMNHVSYHVSDLKHWRYKNDDILYKSFYLDDNGLWIVR